jgi:nitroreductase
MPTPAFDFLATRKSHPLRALSVPVPDAAALAPILAAALRVPDHGKLEPWRLIVLDRQALLQLAEAVATCDAAAARPPEDVAKQTAQFSDAHLAVAVVAAPVASEKIPEMEQALSAGAVCLQLVNAALAAGWGATWLTGWASRDASFLASMGVAAPEWIAGIVYIGTATAVPPERPRPDPAAKVTWLRA